jgi:hypothetical protein
VSTVSGIFEPRLAVEGQPVRTRQARPAYEPHKENGNERPDGAPAPHGRRSRIEIRSGGEDPLPGPFMSWAGVPPARSSLTPCVPVGILLALARGEC